MHNISKCEVKQAWESFRGRIGHSSSVLGCQQHCAQGFPETKQKVSRHMGLPKPSNHVCAAEDEPAFLQQKPIHAEWLLVSFILDVPRSFSAALPTALYGCVFLNEHFLQDPFHKTVPSQFYKVNASDQQNPKTQGVMSH
jgi:hypothetical protein